MTTTIGTRHLYDLFDRAALAAALDDGYVRQQVHPTEPLAILNYTEKAAYENAWTDVTRTCRGLIWRTDTGEVVARPYPKFFNHGQPGAAPLDLSAPVHVSDKLDGSLGILYPLLSGGWAVATRGSFASDQALWATDWFNRYANIDFFRPGLTYLFEILIDWNRIVVRYDWEGLVLIGVVDTVTGDILDLPTDPRLLQARPPRDDRGQHQAEAKRLEDVPGVSVGGSATGQPEESGTALEVPQELERAEPRAGVGVQEGWVPEDPRDDRLVQTRQALHGLRAGLPAVRDGLRPRAGDEEVQRRLGQEPYAARAGDREVRVGLCQLPPDQDVHAFKIVERFECATLADALALPPRPNAEGIVVRCLNTGGMVKIKQEDYVALHRIVTGLTARTVWEHLVAHKPLADLIEPLPDEFHPWVQQVADDIRGRVDAEWTRLLSEYEQLVNTMPPDWNPQVDGATREGRKQFAMVAARHPDSWAMFALLDGRSITDKLLVHAKPEPYLTPSGRTFTEDNA